MRARIIEQIMCEFRVDAAEIQDRFGIAADELTGMMRKVADDFEGLVEVSNDGLSIPQDARPLTRMIARGFDAYELDTAGHSSAI